MCDPFTNLILFFFSIAQSLGIAQLDEVSLPDVHPAPAILLAYSAEGELLTSWTSPRYTFGGWLTAPEWYVHSTSGFSRWLVGGDPKSGKQHKIAWHRGSHRFSDTPCSIFTYSPVERPRIVLPGKLQPWSPDRDPQNVGSFRVVDGAVWFEDELLLSNRGMTTTLSESPSGRFVMITQTQPPHSYMIYSISTDGSSQVEAVRAVSPEELPLLRPEPDRVSPDGSWTVRWGSWIHNYFNVNNGIGVFHRSGRRHIWDSHALEGPWWSPNSDRFAYSSGSSLWIADIHGNHQPLIQYSFAFLGWDGDRILWLARGPSDH